MTGKTHETLVADQFGPRAAAYVESAVHAQGEDLLRLVEIVRGHGGARALDMGCGGGHVQFPCRAACGGSRRLRSLRRHAADRRRGGAKARSFQSAHASGQRRTSCLSGLANSISCSAATAPTIGAISAAPLARRGARCGRAGRRPSSTSSRRKIRCSTPICRRSRCCAIPRMCAIMRRANGKMRSLRQAFS